MVRSRWLRACVILNQTVMTCDDRCCCAGSGITDVLLTTALSRVLARPGLWSAALPHPGRLESRAECGQEPYAGRLYDGTVRPEQALTAGAPGVAVLVIPGTEIGTVWPLSAYVLDV